MDDGSLRTNIILRKGSRQTFAGERIDDLFLDTLLALGEALVL